MEKGGEGEATTVTEKRDSSSRGIGHHSSHGERGRGETTTVTAKRGSSSRERESTTAVMEKGGRGDHNSNREEGQQQ